MYKLIEISEGKWKKHSFKTEEQLCDHLIEGELNILFSTHTTTCYVDQIYVFKNNETLTTYYNLFLGSEHSNKSISFVCDLFEKLHSHNFQIIKKSKNQKKYEH